jgi:hypothetical protein
MNRSPSVLAEKNDAGEVVLTPERLAGENATHDRVIWVLAVVSLAVVSAYPVGPGNPDARLYLAAGRLIVQGEYRYGSDPFTYGEHAPQGWASLQRFLGLLGLGPKQLDWVNSGWLAEVFLYAWYVAGGGAGLVALRVALVLVISLLVWRMCERQAELQQQSPASPRGGSGTATPAAKRLVAVRRFAAWWTVGLLLAGLVWSVGLHIRPESLGVLYLAVALALLAQGPVSSGPWSMAESDSRWRRWWYAALRWSRGRLWFLLPPLFALWANCDSSVLLGLAALLLYWLGQHLQVMWGPDRYARDVLLHEDRRLLGRVIGWCIVAMMVNPFHLHIFDPSPLGFPEAAELLYRGSRQAARLGVSPFTAAYFTGADGRWVGLSLAEWAYYVLVVFTAAGMWLGRAHWRWSWFLLALLGLVLSCYWSRYLPWFALLALPASLPGWHHYLAQRLGVFPTTNRRSVLLGQLGRLAVAATVLGLMVATLWPQPTTGTAAGSITRRGWGFSLFEDASLEAAAQTTAHWWHSGKLPGRGLHLDWLNTSAYWANAHRSQPAVWLDIRAGLFTPQTVRDFLDAVEALEKTGTPEGQQRRLRLNELLRKYDISYLVVDRDHLVVRYDNRGNQMRFTLLPFLLAERDEKGQPVWQMLDYLDGETFLLAWTGSPHWEHLRTLQFSPLRCWQREAGSDNPATSPPFAINSVGRTVEPWRTLRHYFTGQPPPVPLPTSAARFLLEAFQQTREPRYVQLRQQAEAQMLWAALIANTAMLPMGGVTPALAQLGSIFTEGWPGVPRLPLFAYQRDALLWLAWRWSRQGILAEPQQPFAWAVCYDVGNLLDAHESQHSEGAHHESRLLARMFLLRQLARLQPGMANVHLELARRFLERGCDDLALASAEQFLQLSAGLEGDQSQQPASRLQEHLGLSLEQLRSRVQEAQGRFQTWIALLTQPGWVQSNPGEALLRAREMWQSRLANTTITVLQQLTRSLLPRQAEFADAVRLLADVYVQTGDAVGLQRLLQQNWAEAVFGRQRYEFLQALAAGALGDAAQEARRRAVLEDLLQKQAAELFLRGGIAMTLGSDLGPAGSGFYGLMQQHQALMRSRERIYNLLAIASAALEDGNIAQARQAFERVRTIAPKEPLAVLAEHYLRVLPETSGNTR